MARLTFVLATICSANGPNRGRNLPRRTASATVSLEMSAQKHWRIVTRLNPDCKLVRNPLPAQGGVEPETIEDVRQRAPAAFRTQERAVTEADYAEVTQRDQTCATRSGDISLDGKLAHSLPHC